MVGEEEEIERIGEGVREDGRRWVINVGGILVVSYEEEGEC